MQQSGDISWSSVCAVIASKFILCYNTFVYYDRCHFPLSKFKYQEMKLIFCLYCHYPQLQCLESECVFTTLELFHMLQWHWTCMRIKCGSIQTDIDVEGVIYLNLILPNKKCKLHILNNCLLHTYSSPWCETHRCTPCVRNESFTQLHLFLESPRVCKIYTQTNSTINTNELSKQVRGFYQAHWLKKNAS